MEEDKKEKNVLYTVEQALAYGYENKEGIDANEMEDRLSYIHEGIMGATMGIDNKSASLRPVLFDENIRYVVGNITKMEDFAFTSTYVFLIYGWRREPNGSKLLENFLEKEYAAGRVDFIEDYEEIVKRYPEWFENYKISNGMRRRHEFKRLYWKGKISQHEYSDVLMSGYDIGEMEKYGIK